MTDERDLPDDPLEAGLEAGYERDSRAAGESVLAAIERLHGARSQVALREADEGANPVSLQRDNAPAVDDSRYQILGEVARGGVGVIYRGRDKDLNRDVALKVLRTEHAENPDVIQRFIEEAQVGGQLQHPGIVPVYGMGLQPDGRAYFAMKFIKGRTLSALMDSNPQGYDLLAIFEQLAQAMAYAHSRGVIHRDLKPANVMIGSFGEVIVVDWGFAKVLGIMEDQPRKKNTVIATVRSEAEGSQSIAGSVMGTPAYMPPEQAMGLVDELDESSDVFALGAILCEILTGEPPYTGSMRDQLMAAAQARLEEAHARLDECDTAEEIKQIARDCMEPLAKNRPADAGAVAQRLGDHFAAVEERVRTAELETIEADAASEQSRNARKRTWALAAVVLIAILGSGGGYFAWSTARETQRIEAERGVAAALDESARHERDGDLVAAISAAQKAIAVAETDEVSAGDARATLKRLQKEEEERQRQGSIAAKNALVLAQFNRIGQLPLDEIGKRLDSDCMLIVERSFGKGEKGLELLAEFATGSPLAPAIADALHRWLDECEEPKRSRLLALALRIDPSHEELRRAIHDKDTAQVLKLIDERGMDGGPLLIKKVAWALFNNKRRADALTMMRNAIRRHPENGDLREALGWMAFRDGRAAEGDRSFAAAIALEPNHKRMHHGHAMALADAGRLEEAEHLWSEIVARFPMWAHGKWHWAKANIGIDRRVEAERIFRDAVADHPDHLDCLSNLAQLCYQRGDYAHAVELARRYVVKAEAADHKGTLLAGHRSWLGWYLWRNGQTEDAIVEIRRAKMLAPESPGHWRMLVPIHIAQGDYDSATAVARAYLELKPDEYLPWGWVNGCFQKAKDADAAITAFRTLVDIAPESAHAWAAFGYLQMHHDRVAGAQKCADTSRRFDEKHPVAIGLQGRLYEKANRLDEAEAAYRLAAELEPTRAQWWGDLGTLLRRNEDWVSADSAYAKAVNLEPDNTRYLIDYSFTQLRLGKVDSVFALRKKIHRLKPDDYKALANLGFEYLKRDAYEDALPLLTKAVAKWNGSRYSLHNLGSARFHTGDLKGAAEAYEAAINIKEKRSKLDVWQSLGVVRSRLGDDERSAAAYENAIELGAKAVWWPYLAKELRKTRSKVEVRTRLRALVDRCPDRSQALDGLFGAYWANGDFDGLIAYARELLPRAADAPYGLYYLAFAHFMLHQHEEALATLEKMPSELPAHLQAPALGLQANVYERLGRYDKISALLDRIPPSARVEQLRGNVAISKRIEAMVAGHDAPKDSAEAFRCGYICYCLGRYEDAVFFFRQVGLSGEQLGWGFGLGVVAKDPMGKVWFRQYLKFNRERLETKPGLTRNSLQIVGRMWMAQSVRNDPAWRELWEEHARLLKRAEELTW